MADLALVTADRVRIVSIIAEENQIELPAGEAVTAGAPVYIHATTGMAHNADANVAAAAGAYGIMTKTLAVRRTGTAVRRGLLDGWNLDGLDFWTPIYLSATAGRLATAAQAVNEQQTVTITGTPTGGTFTLTYGGATTAGIAFNATAATVEDALEALATIGEGNVEVTGGPGPGTPYVVNFIGALAGQNAAAITANGAGLTGGTPAIAVTETRVGAAGLVVAHVEPVRSNRIGQGIDRILNVDFR